MVKSSWPWLFFVGRLRYFLILLRNFGGFRMCNEKEYLHILLDVVLSGIFFAWSLVFLFWPMRMYWFLWSFGRLIPPYGQPQDSVELLRGPKSIEIYHLKSKKCMNNLNFSLKLWCSLLIIFTLAGCIFVPYSSQRRAVSSKFRSASAGGCPLKWNEIWMSMT